MRRRRDEKMPTEMNDEESQLVDSVVHLKLARDAIDARADSTICTMHTNNI